MSIIERFTCVLPRDLRISKLGLIALLALPINQMIAQSKDPACLTNVIPPTGPTDANGKIIVHVTILTDGDYGWSGTNNGADTSVQQALSCAALAWTNATGSGGQTIPYSFVQDANNSSSSSIVINKQASTSVVAAISPTVSGSTAVSPWVLNLDPKVTTTDTNLCATVTHELGHSLGLDNAKQNSIMGPVIPKVDSNGNKVLDSNGNQVWTPQTGSIQKNDVDSVIFAATSRGSCRNTLDLTKAVGESCDICDPQCNNYSPGDPSCAQCTGTPPCTGAACTNGTWDSSTCGAAPSCDGDPPCDGAVCSGNNTWDTSQCTSVTTAQCDGSPPCNGATCTSDYVWDSSTCDTGCSDVCDPSCSNYSYCACYPDDSSCGGGGGGCDPNGDYCDPQSCDYNPYECECDYSKPTPIGVDPNLRIVHPDC